MSDPRTLRTHPELHSHASFPRFQSLGEAPKNLLEKLLSVFADVRAGEGVSASLLAVNVFLLLASYYLLKTIREALILTEAGAEVKAYSSAAQAAVLLLVIPLFGWLGTKVNRIRLVGGAMLFFIANLLLFALFGSQGVHIGVVFYIWLGIYNYFSVSLIWAFANDIYTEGQGRRLFPFIGVGMSLGGFFGAAAAAGSFERYHLSPYTIMFLVSGVLLVCVSITWTVNLREKRRATPEVAKEADTPLGSEGGFQLIFRERYLLLIAALIILLNVVNTTGEYIFGKMVTTAAAQQFAGAALDAQRKEFVGGIYGSFYTWQNLLGFLIQLLLVSRIVRFAGIRGSLFVLPVISLVGYSITAAVPLLAVIRVTKVLENSTDYSLQNTLRQALWLPTSREAKYKAKAAVDTFFTRFGDMLHAGVVFAGTGIGLGLAGFAWVNVAFAVIWLWIAWQIKREHRRLTV